MGLVAVPGQKFGAWTVIKKVDMGGAQVHQRWWCQCVCGTERAVRASAVVCGRSRGCGCSSTPRSAAVDEYTRRAAATAREAARDEAARERSAQEASAELQDLIGTWGLKKPPSDEGQGDL